MDRLPGSCYELLYPMRQSVCNFLEIWIIAYSYDSSICEISVDHINPERDSVRAFSNPKMGVAGSASQ